MTDLSNLDNFLLDANIETVNRFLGEELVCRPDNEKISASEREFWAKLAHKIHETDKKVCLRKCFFRRLK